MIPLDDPGGTRCGKGHVDFVVAIDELASQSVLLAPVPIVHANLSGEQIEVAPQLLQGGVMSQFGLQDDLRLAVSEFRNFCGRPTRDCRIAGDGGSHTRADCQQDAADCADGSTNGLAWSDHDATLSIVRVCVVGMFCCSRYATPYRRDSEL